MKLLSYVPWMLLLVALPGPVAADFNDPPADGKVIWIFTGAKNLGATTATSVHCSNFDKDDTASMTIEFFDEFGALADNITNSLGAGDQSTWSSQATFFGETIMGSSDFEGSVRVVADGAKKVICSAYVLSPASPPTFVMGLPPFNRTGKP